MSESGSPSPDPVGALVRRAGALGPAGDESARAELKRRLFAPQARLAPQAAAASQAERYVVVSRLGHGGDGVVYGAWDRELDRQVAIKVLRRRGPDAEARLLREARLVAKLRHPGLVQIHDVGRALALGGADGAAQAGVFLVMEYVPGGDLAAWLLRSRRSWREIVRIHAAVARGLAAAHAVGVIHRDVKPTNVLIGSDGQPRVVDFGLAQRGRRETDEPDVAGTLPYMAPEQHGGAAADGRADQYALAVALYEALAGRRPFVGNAGVLLRSKQRAAYARLEKVPRRVARAIDRALAPDPSRRFADMQAFATALEAAARTSTAVWWLGAAAVTTIGLVPFALADPCAVPERSPAATWADREDDGVATEATARVDAIAEQWSAAWRDACVQARVHAEVSPAVHEAQSQCLDRQAVAFAAAHEELRRQRDTMGAGPRTPTIAAVALAVAIEPVGRCDVDAITAMEPEAAAHWGAPAGWEHLARGRVLHELGRDADALAVLRGGQNVLPDARTEPDAPLLRARLHLATARAYIGLGEYERAKQSLLESVWQAEPVRDHASAAEAWLELAWLEGVERTAPDAARWVAFTTAAVARAGDDPWLVAELAHLRGGMHYRAGRFDDALREYGTALVAQREQVGEHHPAVARTRNHLGNTLFEARRLDAAIEASTEALAVRQQIFAPGHPLIAAALNNLAGMHIARGDGAAARELIEESLALLAGQGGPHELVARVVQARIEHALGREDAAVEGYRAALGVRMASIERGHPAAAGARSELAALSRDRDPR